MSDTETDDYPVIGPPQVGQVLRTHKKVRLMAMNLSGRYKGREIRGFGQQVIETIIEDKDVSLFFGQQINFRPKMPPNYHMVGNNKAFISYNKRRFRASDAQRFKQVMRDLQIRGKVPHFYIPENNFVACKFKVRGSDGLEFLGISWLTDECDGKAKRKHLFKILSTFLSEISVIEELPVLAGGTFRIPSLEADSLLPDSLTCYGYFPANPRRVIRETSFFLCSPELLLANVRPLILSKLEMDDDDESDRWLNPEDVFYSDPVRATLYFELAVPERKSGSRELTPGYSTEEDGGVSATELETRDEVKEETDVEQIDVVIPKVQVTEYPDETLSETAEQLVQDSIKLLQERSWKFEHPTKESMNAKGDVNLVQERTEDTVAKSNGDPDMERMKDLGHPVDGNSQAAVSNDELSKKRVGDFENSFEGSLEAVSSNHELDQRNTQNIEQIDGPIESIPIHCNGRVSERDIDLFTECSCGTTECHQNARSRLCEDAAVPCGDVPAEEEDDTANAVHKADSITDIKTELAGNLYPSSDGTPVDLDYLDADACASDHVTTNLSSGSLDDVTVKELYDEEAISKNSYCYMS